MTDIFDNSAAAAAAVAAAAAAFSSSDDSFDDSNDSNDSSSNSDASSEKDHYASSDSESDAPAKDRGEKKNKNLRHRGEFLSVCPDVFDVLEDIKKAIIIIVQDTCNKVSEQARRGVCIYSCCLCGISRLRGC